MQIDWGGGRQVNSIVLPVSVLCSTPLKVYKVLEGEGGGRLSSCKSVISEGRADFLQ